MEIYAHSFIWDHLKIGNSLRFCDEKIRNKNVGFVLQAYLLFFDIISLFV